MYIPVRILLAVTDFGDSAVMSFGTLSACGILFFTGERLAALRFFATMFLTAATIALAKIYFLGCGNVYSHALHIYSPSGHAALSTAFFSGLALFAASNRSFLKQLIIWVGAASAVISISLSRVLLGYHSSTEILMGFVVGAAALVVAWHAVPIGAHDGTFDSNDVANRRRLLILIVGVVLVALCVHGRHFPAEHIIRYIALHVHRYIPACTSV